MGYFEQRRRLYPVLVVYPVRTQWHWVHFSNCKHNGISALYILYPVYPVFYKYISLAREDIRENLEPFSLLSYISLYR